MKSYSQTSKCASFLHFDAGIFGDKGKEGLDKTQSYNIVLPKVQTEGATVNVVLDNKDMKDIVLPGVWGWGWVAATSVVWLCMHQHDIHAHYSTYSFSMLHC